MTQEQKQLIIDFVADAEEYTTWQGQTAYKIFGTLAYYSLLCDKLGITPKTIRYGLLYKARNKALQLDYCEHDIILVKKVA